MSEKYYISDKMFFTDINLDKAWEWLISYIRNIGDRIIITQCYPSNKIEIDNILLEHRDFKNTNPEKVFISNKPYLKSMEELYICRQYKLNEDIYNEISVRWLRELKTGELCPTFVLKHSDNVRFMVTEQNIIARLELTELFLFNNLNFDFKEWDIQLNDTL